MRRASVHVHTYASTCYHAGATPACVRRWRAERVLRVYSACCAYSVRMPARLKLQRTLSHAKIRLACPAVAPLPCRHTRGDRRPPAHARTRDSLLGAIPPPSPHAARRACQQAGGRRAGTGRFRMLKMACHNVPPVPECTQHASWLESVGASLILLVIETGLKPRVPLRAQRANDRRCSLVSVRSMTAFGREQPLPSRAALASTSPWGTPRTALS